MSKELKGRNGEFVGSYRYFKKLNEKFYIDTFLDPSPYYYSYSNSMSSFCSHIQYEISRVYDDLKNYETVLYAVPESDRKNLSEIISSLNDVCKKWKNSSSYADKVISMLKASSKRSKSTSPKEVRLNRMHGKNGYIVCSSYYNEKVKESALGNYTKFMSSFDENYTSAIRKQLLAVEAEILKDIESGVANNDYIKDENGKNLTDCIYELEKLHISCYGLGSKINSLMWFVGGDYYTILEFQGKLNRLGICSLTEDGVYGAKTAKAHSDFISYIENETFPKLEPTSSNGTIFNGDTFSNVQFVQNVSSSFFDAGIETIDPSRANEITNPFFHNKTVGKVFKVGNKLLIFTGLALDCMELSIVLEEDLNDADGRLGKKTAATAVDLGTAYLSAALGSKIGAALGTLFFPGIGTFVFSFGGGFIGGILGDKFSDCILDITNLVE